MDKHTRKTRKMTVCNFGGNRSIGMETFSELRLRGKWLKDAGFKGGHVVTIECNPQELIIRTDGTRKHN